MDDDTQTSQPLPPPPPPPPQEQPDSKKPKLSTTTTTTTSDDEDRTPATATADKKPRYKRRKIAILFAYCGVGYQGMQKNPGAKTIEGDLEEALYFSGAVPESDRGCPHRFDFARSARTDKGVSAVGQVVSGKFYVDPPGFIDRLNNNLPAQFRVFGFKRVTASFSAKKFCDRRRYVYLLPVFALDPNSHRDRESVLASLGSDNELVKCLACSERGRKVDFDVDVRSGISSNALPASEVETRSGISSNALCALAENTACLDGGDVDGGEKVFRYGDKEKERFNKILKQYEGTHNFHNFTTRTKAGDPSAKRYIISFHAGTTVAVDGIEFVKCEVIGQSFMLHQIRKMVGVAVAIMRNCAPESLMEKALRQDVRITVPTAPEVGLYLDECFFSSYNQKWKDTHEEVSMKAYAEEAEEFKLKHIYSHIASTEHKEGSVAVWLHSLNHRNYPDLCPEENEGANEAPRGQAEAGVTTTGCNPNILDNQKANPRGNKSGMLLDLVASGRFRVWPLNIYMETTVLEIDLEHLATTMKSRLNLVFPSIQELCDRYYCRPGTDVTDNIVSDVNAMVDAAMSVTYNRLRYVLQRYDPNASAARMNPRSPLSNRLKFPAFISSVLGSIGPLGVTDGPKGMRIVYATSADRSKTYGRVQSFDFACGRFDRLAENLEAIGVPMAPIEVKAGGREGSFFSTIIPNYVNGEWDFTAPFHHSHYKHKDILSAWLTNHPDVSAFEDCSLTVGCCSDPSVIGALDDPGSAAAPTRPVGGTFPVNISGVRPSVAAEGVVPAVPAAAYVIGRGTERYYCTSLARMIHEDEMLRLLRDFIFMPMQGDTSF